MTVFNLFVHIITVTACLMIDFAEIFMVLLGFFLGLCAFMGDGELSGSVLAEGIAIILSNTVLFFLGVITIAVTLYGLAIRKNLPVRYLKLELFMSCAAVVCLGAALLISPGIRGFNVPDMSAPTERTAALRLAGLLLNVLNAALSAGQIANVNNRK